MDFDYPHSLPLEDARLRLQALGDYLQNRHGLKVAIAGDRGRFSGKVLMVRIEGEFVLGDQKIHVTGKDPGILLRRKATDYLRRKLAAYFDPAVPVEDLPRE
jgi:hypothetical protein